MEWDAALYQSDGTRPRLNLSRTVVSEVVFGKDYAQPMAITRVFLVT